MIVFRLREPIQESGQFEIEGCCVVARSWLDAGVPLKEACRKHGFSEASYYLWRNKVRRHGRVLRRSAKLGRLYSAELGRWSDAIARRTRAHEP